MMGRKDWDQASLFIGRSLTDARASCGALFLRSRRAPGALRCNIWNE